MTRTRRFLRGVGVGYFSQMLTMAVGLVLVPFLLHQLGTGDYGQWLVIGQLFGYLALLDLGVMALLPRLVAGAQGSGTPLAPPAARALHRALRQLPVLAVIAVGLWWFLPASWDPARGPLAVMLTGFVAGYPLRIGEAVLQGVQDLERLGWIRIAGWSVTTLLTVALVLAGLGLWGMAIAWTTGYLGQLGVTLARSRRFLSLREVWRPSEPPPAFAGRPVWVSVGQVAHVCFAGTELLVAGFVLGPTAVVVYSITGKLAHILANQPQMLLATAEPGLAELRASGHPGSVDRATRALTEVVLLLSGALACVVMAVNAGFVAWWVGPENWGGRVLTGLILARILGTHLTVALGTALFAMGYERFLALVGLATGILTVVLLVVGATLWGLVGIAIAPLAALALVNLPPTIITYARTAGKPPSAVLFGLLPWFWRFALAISASVVAGMTIPPRGPFAMAAMSLLVLAGYGVLTLGRIRSAPLVEYLHPTIQARLGARRTR